MAFLDKLKRKIEVLEDDKQPLKTEKIENGGGSNYVQLDVDIYEAATKYIIIAVIAGVDLASMDISVGEENDVLIIQGKKASPIEILKQGEKNLVLHHQECQWGDFYRQIILPQEINPERVDAYEDKGVLIINLPLLRLQKGVKSIQIKSKE
jgi:HSP20 family protein